MQQNRIMFDRIYPKNPQELKQNELKTLKFLKEQPFFCINFQDLFTDATREYSRNQHQLEGFKFESQIDLTIEGRLRRILFGGQIDKIYGQAKYQNVTYYMGICKTNCSPDRFIRKFHFDCVIPEITTKRKRPFFHLQYAGTLSPHLKVIGYNSSHDGHMNPEISQPRISYFPMSLALLLNLIFVEADDVKIISFLESREWRYLIKRNEDLLLKPYYKEFYKIIEKDKKNKTVLTLDYWYAK